MSERRESIRPRPWQSIDTGMVNPYTCRTLIRIDEVLWRLRGKETCWLGGMLCERMSAGHGVELRSHFPGALFVAAAKIQNRWPWTRKALSL